MSPQMMPESAVSEHEIVEIAGWSRSRRVAFRFAFCYLVLYSFPFPVGAVPYTESISEACNKIWNALIPWLGKHLLGLNITVFPNGSGDTTFNYLQVAAMLAIAVVAAAIWSVLDRKRLEYERLSDMLRVYVRFVLGATMITYGMVKVIKTQFPSPSLGRLIEPYGDSSPMGLLWTFMGYSLPYNFFTGSLECLGGFLLFFRRTTLLGSLISAAVMANIVALNFCYDVPVKLYSTHLLLMACFLLLPDAGRSFDVLVRNRPAAAANIASPYLGWKFRPIKYLFIACFLYQPAAEAWKHRVEVAKRSPVYGIYEVEEFERNHQTLPPSITESTRWRKIVSQGPGRFSVKTMDDSAQQFNAQFDAASHRVMLTSPVDKAQKGEFAYEQPDKDHLVLQGSLGGDLFRVRARRIDETRFLLTNRGFHWTNEYPLNR